ncbi:hypothetical protein Poly24_11530 [Rosistilla carotiformis]|uniref:Uncharacterized protein n=1 Tax=Rosistilla carotiformis TaxID=2528017 RepID=A0A518JPJ5_9BACT|nr:hypothetical protein [Rosistilla carotiformis]QDV67453.1 hypothetical protein Poly24_11530 [Rosistilla carotiformis]
MDKNTLKLYAPRRDMLPSAPTVTVSVGDLVPLLVDAWETDRNWLRDFCKDEVSVSEDLYEVLLAYHQIRRCEAA